LGGWAGVVGLGGVVAGAGGLPAVGAAPG